MEDKIYKTILVTHNATYVKDKRAVATFLKKMGGVLFNDNVFQLFFHVGSGDVISKKLEELSQMDIRSYNFSIKIIKVDEKSVGVFTNGTNVGEKV